MVTNILVPLLNANDHTAEVAHWYVEDGAVAVKGQDLVDLGTSKANVVIQAEVSGRVKQHAKKGQLIEVGALLATIEPTEQKSLTEAVLPAVTAKHEGPRFSKLAEKLMGGDLKAPYVSSMPDELITSKNLIRAPGLRRAPLTKVKTLEIEALTSAQEGNINSSLTVQFSAAPILRDLREKRLFGGSPAPILYSHFSRTLKKHPKFTAFFHRNEIHHYDSVNLAVAIDLGEGLRVPAIRGADQLTPMEIYENLLDLSFKVAQNKLSLADLEGGTVTVTDLFSQNILSFQPLLNYRQSVILGIGGDATLPDQPVTLTLAFDHRVLTGKEVALFLNEFKNSVLNASL